MVWCCYLWCRLLSRRGESRRILQERRHAGTCAFQVPLPSILSSRKSGAVTTRHRRNPASTASLTTPSSLLREHSQTEPLILNRYDDDNPHLLYEYSLLWLFCCSYAAGLFPGLCFLAGITDIRITTYHHKDNLMTSIVAAVFREVQHSMQYLSYHFSASRRLSSPCRPIKLFR